MMVKGMEAFGAFDEDNDRLIVRLLGRRYGICSGWFHWDNWAVVAPGFIPDQWFRDMVNGLFPDLLPTPVTVDNGFALAVDFYAGEWVLLAEAQPHSVTTHVAVRGTLRVVVPKLTPEA